VKEKQATALEAWKEGLLVIDRRSSDEVYNTTGHSRTFEENKLLVVLPIRYALEKYLQLVEYRYDVLKSQRHSRSRASTSRCCARSTTKLTVFSCSVRVRRGSRRGTAAANYDVESVHRLLTAPQMKALALHIDERQAIGGTTTNLMLTNWTRLTLKVDMHRKTMRTYLGRLGLSWNKVKPKRRTLGSYRQDVIWKFIIRLNEIYVEMNEQGDAWDKVLVCRDESYVHQHHVAQGNSYVFKKHFNTGKSTS
jgi:transposase